MLFDTVTMIDGMAGENAVAGNVFNSTDKSVTAYII
jgi:hypothetical protein